ncbi:MAG: hypothetical protein JWM99_4677 [Verrucomicrobiales bacterium]|nr:hypothetical protein [Verrucomicrobiales bacterium]
MKIIIVGLLLSVIATFGAPLERKEISADAKWLLHLDVDAFRQTAVGKYIFSDVLDKKLNDAKKAFPLIGVLVGNVQSLTAFGNEATRHDRNGVLLIKTDVESEKKLETLLQAGMAGVTQGFSVEKLDIKDVDVYKVNKDLFVQALHNGHLLVGKSQTELNKAREVLATGNGSLSESKAFTGFGNTDHGFFLLGIAEGLGESAKAFPQAKILQMAEGGQLTIGEREDKLNFRLALKSKDQESCNQMQQVIQGLIALVSLTQSDNKELNTFIQTLKIDKGENLLKINLSFPVSNAIKEIADKQKG